ncbi:predicted protein [Sparassis crispa]|uniref:Uncharacterized protein n=1 Tax=Sparassis crispa TaxID=139825 RepID=A0A401GZT8_9APHY|nr:predicted protein [Sparassis crispa]GBE87681.1 predicted protein [Sparassis crispa]
MPTTRSRALLDSSAVDIPPVRRPPPKRSASHASLPTPPRTATKRKRARSRATDSDVDEDEHVPAIGEDEHSDDPERERASRRDGDGALIIGHKKRKTLDAIAEELSEAVVEEAFWLDDRNANAGKSQLEPKSLPRTRARSRTRSPSSSPPPAAHLLRRGHTGLISPPPSRRQRTRVGRRPVTPRPRASTSGKPSLFPKRDSPDNPFLADTPDDSPTTPVRETDAGAMPHTPVKQVEKPTLTWVFRGKKVELANPHFHGTAEDDEDDEETAKHCLLPEGHPDYSPPPTYAPKLLFPEAHKHTRRRAPKAPVPTTEKASIPMEAKATSKMKAKAEPAEVSPSDADPSDDEHDDEAVEELVASTVTEAAVQAAMEERLAKRIDAATAAATRTRTRSQAAPRLPEVKDSDIPRRAMGPARAPKPVKSVAR